MLKMHVHLSMCACASVLRAFECVGTPALMHTCRGYSKQSSISLNHSPLFLKKGLLVNRGILIPATLTS